MAWLASFGKSLGKKNPFKINKMSRMARMARQKWRGGDFGKAKKKKESERECKWNVNKPYRIVNWKTAKLAKWQDKRQFAHGSIEYYFIIILYIIFYIIYYRVTEFRHFFATFRALSCYFVLLHVNCYANVTALSWQGEVMGWTLTNLTGLFLLLFKCKQIGTIYDALTLV